MAYSKKKGLIGAGTGAAQGFATGGPVGAVIGAGAGLLSGITGGDEQGGASPATALPPAPENPTVPYSQPASSFASFADMRRNRMNQRFPGMVSGL